MTRVKRGIATHKRHKRIIGQAKGFWGQRKNVFKRVKETLLRAWAFAFVGRKLKKRSMRGLFITRIKAATNQHGVSYSSFMHSMKLKNVKLNRKMLSELSIAEPQAFTQLVSLASGNKA